MNPDIPPSICKLRCGIFADKPLDHQARQCVHDPDPNGYGPHCSGDRDGFCFQRIIRSDA